MDDIECHSYDEISTSPPVLIDTMDDRIKMVVEEMQRFKEEVGHHADEIRIIFYSSKKSADLVLESTI